MPKICALLAVSALLTACFDSGVALEPKAKSVTLVHESERPLRCKFLDKISGTAHGSDEKAARESAENDFRNQAAKLNANFALVEAERGGRLGDGSDREFFVGGKALFCQTDEMAEADEKAAAAAKEKKEAEAAKREEEEKSDKQDKAKNK